MDFRNSEFYRLLHCRRYSLPVRKRELFINLAEYLLRPFDRWLLPQTVGMQRAKCIRDLVMVRSIKAYCNSLCAPAEGTAAQHGASQSC